MATTVRENGVYRFLGERDEPGYLVLVRRADGRLWALYPDSGSEIGWLGADGRFEDAIGQRGLTIADLTDTGFSLADIRTDGYPERWRAYQQAEYDAYRATHGYPPHYGCDHQDGACVQDPAVTDRYAVRPELRGAP